jgi:hypothetical protein
MFQDDVGTVGRLQHSERERPECFGEGNGAERNLQTVQELLLKALVIYADKLFIKHHNCILLESMKATEKYDEEQLGRIRKDWHRNIDMAFSTH